MILNPMWIAGGFTTPDWTDESNEAFAYYGWSVRSAGDVNGDGYADVIIGAPFYDNGQPDEGQVDVYLGSAAGLAATPAWSADSDQAGNPFTLFGGIVASGDVNGDGFDDVLVTAWDYDNGEFDEGQAWVFHGSGVGLDTTAAWTAQSDQTYSDYGISGAFADVNGDGYADVIIGALSYSGGEMAEGRAYLYYGSVNGLLFDAAWTAESNQESASFGSSVASAGDVNGDGFDDVLVGAYRYENGAEIDEGRASLYLGSATGLAAAPAWTSESDQSFAWYGASVAGAGDVNADGYDDVIISAPNFDNGSTDEGRAWVYLGSATGLALTPAWTTEPDQSFANLDIMPVAGAGDVNADGYDDVLVGYQQWDGGSADQGAVFVFLGTATGLEMLPAFVVESGQASSRFGFAVASAGDVNGDDFDDILVGAIFHDNGQSDEGRAFLYAGTCADTDGDGFCEAQDCDDNNTTVYPGAYEACDGLDNACSGSVPLDEIDEDGDGEATCDGDCDDANPTRFSTAIETCNGRDDNCDGEFGADELDTDDDGVSECEGDCDDANARTSPLLTELCGDVIDNNCDGEVDERCDADTDAGEAGCACNGTGGTAGAPLLALALLLRSRRRA